MQNKHKVFLVKIIIALAAFFNILAVILGVTSEMGLYNNFNETINNIAFVLIAIGFSFTFIMIILIFKIDINPKKTKPKKYNICTNDFYILRNAINNRLKQENYNEFKIYENGLYKIEFSIKNNFRNQYVVALLKTNELSEDIYNDFKNNYFNNFDDYLIENNYINPANAISIFYVICVNKKNKTFKKYIEKNVYQFYKRYNLPIGVDLENKFIYIATQKEGLAKNKYNKLKRMFEKYIVNIIRADNKN